MSLLKDKLPYIIYHLRWQGSIVCLWPVMYLLEHLINSIAIKLILANFIGACIFWFVDRLIFSSH